MAMTAAAPSLRQRKKDMTRSALLKASERLFAKQGYDNTTLDQIAAEANVSRPTVLAYFQTKERLALAVMYDAQEQFRQAVYSDERTVGTIQLWRDLLDENLQKITAEPRHHRAFMRDLSAALARGRSELLQQDEDILAYGLAKDHGTDPADLSTRMSASMLVYGVSTLFRQWFAGGCKANLRQQVMRVIDFVEARFPKPGAPLR